MEADVARAASGAAAEASGQLDGGVEKMDIEHTGKRWVPAPLTTDTAACCLPCAAKMHLNLLSSCHLRTPSLLPNREN